jgi:hypothetical protein
VVSFSASGITKYAALPLDPQGNAIANIIPRTGTLASLLALDGGNGEISVATDVQALVRHNGTPGGAVAHYRAGVTDAVYFDSFSYLGVPSGATGAVPATAPIKDTSGLADGAQGGSFSLPDGAVGSLFIEAQWGPSAAGTYRKIAVEVWAGGAWVEYKVFSIPAAADANQVVVMPYCPNNGEGGVTPYRFKAYQDSGAALDLVSGTFSVLVSR